MNTPATFLDSDILLRLEQAMVSTKHGIRGTLQGKRRSSHMGSSLDFADYRHYMPGDDIRQLDWNAYGRTGKAFIKQFLDEQELNVNVYIDASKSMDFGGKHLYARQMAACIGYIALNGYDRVGVRMFSDRLHEQLPPLRGKGSAHRLFHFLSEAKVWAAGDIAKAIMQVNAIPRQPGMTWIFSDFLYESGVEETLAYLRAARQEVAAVQILSPEEVKPVLSGDLRLVDSESGSGKEVAVSSKVLKAYQLAVSQYTESLRRYCHDHDITYVLATTDTPLPDTLFRNLKRIGLLN